jgi:hypothetical protein
MAEGLEMMMLLFCHQFSYDPGATAWLWLLPAAAVGGGFTLSLVNLIREMKGGRK